ncbi:MAG: PEP-CTERM sorting domain-containing protein [Acidobacteria bacterium]|nr:PEP-CTERM sorting domain-containing protein [Acidobacteriota bacterium]
MKQRPGVLIAVLLVFGVAHLTAAPVALVGNMYSSAYSYNYSYSSPAPQGSQGSPNQSSSQQTLQNAANTLNPSGTSAPGVSSGVPAANNPMPTSFYYNPYSYGFGLSYSGFFGAPVVYQRVLTTTTTPASTPSMSAALSTSPTFTGGLTPGQILTDPAANPEPGTLVLLASGVGGLLFWRRRRG